MDLSRYDTEGARERVARLAVRSPLLPSRWLSDLTGAPVYLKLECLQTTGSFKIRGATNRVLALSAAERARGLVACSSGNHGLAVATVARRLDLAATICVPEWVDREKLRAMRAAGAEVVVRGDTAEEAERISLQLCREVGATYVHPFDDAQVIAGQGTIGHEIVEQLPGVETVLVPTSGGGLVGGIAVALRRLDPSIAVVAASAARARALAESVRCGELVALPQAPTVATALAGNLGPSNEHTLALARTLVSEWVDARERAIRQAMRELWRHHRLVVEGGGAVGVAALLAGWRPRRAGPLVVVLSGGNVELAGFTEIVEATAERSQPRRR